MNTEINTLNDIKQVDASYLAKEYIACGYSVKFSAERWAWVAINTFGFASDSDDNLKTLLKRILCKK